MNFSMTAVTVGAELPRVDFKTLKVGDFITYNHKLSKTEYRNLLNKAKRNNKRLETKTISVPGGYQVLVHVADYLVVPEKFWEIEYYFNNELREVRKFFHLEDARGVWNTLIARNNEDYIFQRKETGKSGKLDTVMLDSQ